MLFLRDMDYRQVKDWQKLPELKRLKDLKRQPETLFYRGQWQAETFANCVAIVGSRRMTQYGRRVIEKMVPKLVFERKTIVSGFMYGVDQYAHRMAVENGGRTIAVLGWGIKQKLESADEALARQIIKANGLLISEWEDQRALLWTFPVRNRIVAALANEVIVVEAGVKSGSLITANLALQLKRKLVAVPGPVTSRVSAGTNQLIADGLAAMWTGENERTEKSRNQEPLIVMLMNEALSADEVARRVNQPVANVGAQLSLLTIRGEIVEKDGKYYVPEI